MELWDLYLGWPNSLKISTLSWSRISRNFKDCPWKILDYFNSSTLDFSLEFLENINLELIWKLEDFQGVPLKNPWTFNLFNPWLVYDIPWKCLPWIELGIQGLPRKFLEYENWSTLGLSMIFQPCLENKGFSRTVLE